MTHTRNDHHKTQRPGFSLIELLVVMAIMLIIIAAVAMVSGTVRTQARTRNTEGTIQILTTALDAYKSYRDNNAGTFQYPTDPFTQADLSTNPWIDNNSDGFHDNAQNYFEECWEEPPLDFDINIDLTFALDTHYDNDQSEIWDNWTDLDGYQQNMYLAARGSIEFLYWILADTKASRDILENLPNDYTSNLDNDELTIPVGSSEKTTTLIEVNDAWGHPLRYHNMDDGNYPEIRSAGPDGIFDNADDIVSGEL